MYVRPSAPLPIGSVLDDALKLYRQSLRRCLPISIIVALVRAAVALWLLFHVTALTRAGISALTAYRQPGVFLLYLLDVIVLLGFYGATVVLQESLAAGALPLSVAQACGIGFRRLPSAIGAALLAWLVIAIGIALLVVPGIYLMIALCLSQAAVYLETFGPVQALHRSRDLTRGNWWRTLAILSVAAAIFVVAGTVAGVLAGALAILWRRDPMATQIVLQALGVVINALLMPLFPAVIVAIYHDLKLRREGADLAARVGALAKG